MRFPVLAVSSVCTITEKVIRWSSLLQMKLLVVTPTLGVSPFLDETVMSVAAVGAGVRHIFVCPSSVSGELRRRFGGVEVLAEDAPGLYVAINRGLTVPGDWEAWTWLNDDDRWVPDGVCRAMALLEREPAVEVVYGRVAFIGPTGGYLAEMPIETLPSRLAALHAAGVAALTQQGTLVRRSVLDRIGALDVSYRLVADFDYWIRLLLAGVRFACVDTPVAEFRVHAGQLSQDVEAMRAETWRSVATHFETPTSLRPRMAAAWFRFRRLPEIVHRFRRTGCWRIGTLIRRAAADR